MPGNMSLAHIQGFLDDVRKIDPAFSERTSCLRGLMEHLRETTHNPRSIAGTRGARGFCEDPNDVRIGRFKPAIKRLIQVWGTDRPYPGHEVPIGRLVFRGDSRPPGVVFNAGFLKEGSTQVEYRDRNHDINPDTGVALTPNPHVAAQFPLPDGWGPEAFRRASQNLTWVYAVHLQSGFNTMMNQGLDAASGSAEAARVLYASELATVHVRPEHILGGLCVKRQFNFPNPPIRRPPDWYTYGVYSFMPHTWVTNPGYKGPNADKFLSVLAEELTTMQRPFVKPTAGFVRNDPSGAANAESAIRAAAAAAVIDTGDGPPSSE